jgi:hypothetical protein
VIIRRMRRFCAGILMVGIMGGGLGLAQAPASAQTTTQPSTAYQPKFKGDPARSESEAQALAYMRTLLRAQHEYQKRHDKFADSLAALAGTGSFTKRMAQSTDRGDYTVSFRVHKDGFVLRSFYAEDDMIIHGDDQKPADEDSPKVK